MQTAVEIRNPLTRVCCAISFLFRRGGIRTSDVKTRLMGGSTCLDGLVYDSIVPNNP